MLKAAAAAAAAAAKCTSTSLAVPASRVSSFLFLLRCHPLSWSAYRDLVLHWMSERYTLRYSGGLVPDLHHILAKARQHEGRSMGRARRRCVGSGAPCEPRCGSGAWARVVPGRHHGSQSQHARRSTSTLACPAAPPLSRPPPPCLLPVSAATGRVAACSATPPPPPPPPSCAACTRRSPWRCSQRRQAAPATTAAGQVSTACPLQACHPPADRAGGGRPETPHHSPRRPPTSPSLRMRSAGSDAGLPRPAWRTCDWLNRGGGQVPACHAC